MKSTPQSRKVESEIRGAARGGMTLLKAPRKALPRPRARDTLRPAILHPGQRYARMAVVCEYYGLSEGAVVNWMKAGVVKGGSLRVDGATQGVRWIDVRSLEAAIARACGEKPEEEKVAA